MSISDCLSEIRARITRAREGRLTDRYMVLDVDAPALVAALRVVFDLHRPFPFTTDCQTCGQRTPCPTIQAIETTLGEGHSNA